MGDPQPLRAVGAVVIVGLLLLGGWWLMLPAPEQVARLARVAVAEQADTPPPAAVDEQPAWMVRHRLGLLHGMAGWLGLALLLGTAEGIAKRQRALYGGFLLKWWTVGFVAAVLAVTSASVFLVAPWPLAGLGVPCGLAGLVALAGFGLGAGRPMIY